MDYKQQNPPQLGWHASWLLILKVRDKSEPMLVKPGGRLNHVDPAGVTNERAMALFIRDEFLLPKKIRYHRCKGWVKLVRDGQVELLHTKVQLVGAAPHSHEPRFSYALYPCDHALVSPRHLLLAIQRRSNNNLAPV